jgi:hypothetical protein
MMCYRDMTFCREDTCIKFKDDCERAYTTKVQAEALGWWASHSAIVPVCFFTDRPECYDKGDKS